jgi:hypothetical protein
MTWNTTTQAPITTSLGYAEPVDAHPFRNGLLVTNAGTGEIVHVTGDDFGQRELIATLPGALFLAGDDDDINVYASNTFAGTIVQIVEDGVVLSSPITLATGLVSPEGLALVDDKYLLYVDTGTGALERLDLESGSITVVAEGLGFQPGIPDVLPIGFPNKVVVYGEYSFLNGDESNVIYRIPLTLSAKNPVDDISAGDQGLLSVYAFCLFAMGLFIVL